MRRPAITLALLAASVGCGSRNADTNHTETRRAAKQALNALADVGAALPADPGTTTNKCSDEQLRARGAALNPRLLKVEWGRLQNMALARNGRPANAAVGGYWEDQAISTISSHDMIERRIKYGGIDKVAQATSQVATSQYLAVLKTLTISPPTLGATTFTPGAWVGMVYVVRKRDAAIICQTRFVGSIERNQARVQLWRRDQTRQDHLAELLRAYALDTAVSAVNALSGVLIAAPDPEWDKSKRLMR